MIISIFNDIFDDMSDHIWFIIYSIVFDNLYILMICIFKKKIFFLIYQLSEINIINYSIQCNKI